MQSSLLVRHRQIMRPPQTAEWKVDVQTVVAFVTSIGNGASRHTETNAVFLNIGSGYGSRQSHVLLGVGNAALLTSLYALTNPMSQARVCSAVFERRGHASAGRCETTMRTRR